MSFVKNEEMDYYIRDHYPESGKSGMFHTLQNSRPFYQELFSNYIVGIEIYFNLKF